jgi:hypothetical protein
MVDPADDVSPEELARHVQAMHGVPARFVEAVEVHEKLPDGRTVWDGAVKVFALTGHPSGAILAYVWRRRRKRAGKPVSQWARDALLAAADA